MKNGKFSISQPVFGYFLLLKIALKLHLNGNSAVCILISSKIKLYHYIAIFHFQAACLSRDGQYMMMGGANGVVEVWRTHDLTLLYTYPQCDSAICSICLSHDHK